MDIVYSLQERIKANRDKQGWGKMKARGMPRERGKQTQRHS